jgi:flagellar basal-body rod protein FlgB
MNIKNIFQKGLLDRTAEVLSRALDYRSANQQIISANLANVDTPGFKPKKLSFDLELQQAENRRNVSLRVTDPAHFSYHQDESGGDFHIEIINENGDGSDKLNIDAEMARMTQNNLLYEASVRLLSKKFSALRSAIEGSRR